MESSVDACTEKLVKSILESRAYRRFIRAQENLDKRPDLKEQINQYRTDIFKLYEEGADEDLIDTSDILEKKFQSMQKIPEVNAYLDAAQRESSGSCCMSLWPYSLFLSRECPTFSVIRFLTSRQ